MSAATTFGALAPGARFRLLPAGPVWCKVNGLARDYAGPMPDPRMTGYSLSDDRKVYPVDDAEYLEHLRLAEPSPSPAARRWAERIDSGTFEHGHVRSFAGLVARMAEGLPYRGDGGVGGCRAHPTTLREHEAVELVRLLAELVREVAEVATLAATMPAEEVGDDRETAETWARNLAGVTIGETCHRCGAATGEVCTLADREYVTYCPPCRAAMVLPCDCGGTFERGRGPGRPPLCPDCGTICAYYDDDDLTDPDGEVVS